MEDVTIRKTMTKINGTALMNAFKKRDLDSRQIAESFGYSKNYFSSCARTNAIRTSLAELLWNEYNIPLDEYRDGAKETVEEVRDDDHLYSVIRKAVADAINDSQYGLYAAFYGAIKKAMGEEEK